MPDLLPPLTHPPSQAVLDILEVSLDQPTARLTKDLGKYDTTSCTESRYKDVVHRDWLAHNIRWAWATRWIKKGSRVIEPGCGRDTPLFRAIRTRANIIPSLYVGVDLDKINYLAERKRDTTYPWMKLHEHFNFVEQADELAELYGEESFELTVSFEVYEHIRPELGLAYLDAVRRFMAPDGVLLLSTPVFNGKKAANHIREYTIDELKTILEDRGFEIVDRYGTFASYHDVKRGIRETMPDDADVIIDTYERCRELHGDDLLACMLAPLLPDYSRNNAWVCKRAT